MQQSKKILISPLNWGLGHASRLMPIIDWCILNDKNVIIAGNGESLKLLSDKYPQLITEFVPAPCMRYGKKKAIGMSFVIRSFLFILNSFRERLITKRLIKKHNVDTIISDNRPGIFIKELKTIYITHQLNVYTSKTPNISSRFLSSIHGKIIKKYTHCWIPDYENNHSLAGRMSENLNNMNLNYIGPLSRFENLTSTARLDKQYEVVCIVSGPEPQRSKFENYLSNLLKNHNANTLIIRGLPASSTNREKLNNITYLNHCNDKDFYNYVINSDIIFCRSGYSTIMDLIVTNKKAVLIPTPGQPEQEYLADYLNDKYGFVKIVQSEIDQFDLDKINFKRQEELIFNPDTLKKILALHL